MQIRLNFRAVALCFLTLGFAIRAVPAQGASGARAAGNSAPVAGQRAGASQPSMQYSILIWERPDQIALRTDSASGVAYWAAFSAFGERLQHAGVLRGGTALKTGPEVRTVTVRNGVSRATNGPRVSSSEQLGGYFVIEVASIEDALRWAEQVPSAITGAVEVRPAYPAPTMKP
jgi:hypothetical protein